MPTNSFREVFNAHHGKVSDKWDSYIDAYGESFAPLREEPIALLEVGIQNGGSLEVWATYFQNARIILGVDIDPKSALLRFEDARISIIIGDVKSIDTQAEIIKNAAKFDIIIDDGSHVSRDIIATFLRLVPLLADEGVYIIEDMHASYWKEFGGELFAPYSAASFFKALTDFINNEHWSLDKPSADFLRPYSEAVGAFLPIGVLERIKSVTFLNSMCIVRLTAGQSAKLGPRRIVGTLSEVAPFVEFSTKAFARRSKLEATEDSFWAWQDRPPIETLASVLAAKQQTEVALAALQRELDEVSAANGVAEVARAALQRELDEVSAAKGVAEVARAGLQRELDGMSAAKEMAEVARAGLQRELTAQAGVSLRLSEIEDQNARSNAEASELRHRLALMHQSTSWRVTGPFRFTKRAVFFVWHLAGAFWSSGGFLTRSCLRLLSRSGSIQTILRRLQTDHELRSGVLRSTRMTPPQYEAVSTVAHYVQVGIGKLGLALHKFPLAERMMRRLSGATRWQDHARTRGTFFHLDAPNGALVPARGGIVFRGWAIDIHAGEVAPVRVVANGKQVRVNRHSRGDVIAAFHPRVAEKAEVAFQAWVGLVGRFTRVVVEVNVGQGEWLPMHKSLLIRSAFVDEIRANRTYDPAEWTVIEKRHIDEQENEMRAHIGVMILRPAFLVVVDARTVDQTSAEATRRALEQTLLSLSNQIYPASRIVVLGGERIRQAVAEMSSGSVTDVIWIDLLAFDDQTIEGADYGLFLRPGDRLARHALYRFAAAINREPASELIYSDETIPPPSATESRDGPLPFRKPDWSPDYLESFDYIGRSGVFLLARARDLSLPFDGIYDFVLRFTENLGGGILHLDDLLVERAASLEEEQDDDSAIAAIEGRMRRTGRRGTTVRAHSGISCYHTRLQWDAPPTISIVIPTAGYVKEIGDRKIDLITNITQQIVDQSSFRDAEIIVVDNGDLSEPQQAHLARLGCRTITFTESVFNVAKKLNLGASIATGELLLLMNDDMEIIQEDWIERLCDHMAKPEVGVVGCKLLYPDQRTQHVGVIQSSGNPDHVRRGYPSSDAGYFDSSAGVRNYLAVTGACMLTRRSLYHRVGGYTEELAVSYNDADFCLKVRDAGYRTVFSGDVAVIHMESLSRVPEADKRETRFFQERWTPKIPSDPFYNERFQELIPPSFKVQTNDRDL